MFRVKPDGVIASCAICGVRLVLGTGSREPPVCCDESADEHRPMNYLTGCLVCFGAGIVAGVVLLLVWAALKLRGPLE